MEGSAISRTVSFLRTLRPDRQVVRGGRHEDPGMTPNTGRSASICGGRSLRCWSGISRPELAPAMELCDPREQAASAAQMGNQRPVCADRDRNRQANLGNHGSPKPGPIPTIGHLLRTLQSKREGVLEELGDDGLFRREAAATGHYSGSSREGRILQGVRQR